MRVADIRDDQAQCFGVARAERPCPCIRDIPQLLDRVPRLTLGEVGNPGGSPEATRRQVNKAFLQDMSKAWDKHGMKSFASRTQAQLQQMLKDQRPKRDLEMIELGIVFVLSVVMLIAVVVTMWIVGIKV